MPSRRKRKRYCQKRAEATALASQTRGGWGPDAPLSRSDLVLLRTAANHDWPAPAPVRQLAVDRIMAAVDEADRTDDARMMLAVANTAITLDAANLRDERGQR